MKERERAREIEKVQDRKKENEKGRNKVREKA